MEGFVVIPAVVYNKLLEGEIRKKKRLGKRKISEHDREQIDNKIKIAKVRDEVVVLALLGRDDKKEIEFPPTSEEHNE